jgi:hypothetical protein
VSSQSVGNKSSDPQIFESVIKELNMFAGAFL